MSTSLLPVLLFLTAAAPNEAALDWMVTAHADGRHNAFTDLAQWKGDYYLCFRHGASHSSTDGEIRIMRSEDLRAWEPCGTLDTLGDDRDPHFCATDDTLYVYFGVWDLEHQAGHRPTGRGSIRSHMATTRDGKDWSKVQAIYEPKWWVWRVIHRDGTFYGAAYTAFRPTPPERELRLLTSDNGLDWKLHATVGTERGPSESDMWFADDGAMRVVTRMTDKSNEAFIYQSDPALEEWTEHGLGAIIHSPGVAHWHDRTFVAGRGKGAEGWVTRLWEIVDGQAVECITLPSGGDTAYPGLLVDPASLDAGQPPALFVSWYSQHDRKSEPNATGNTASVYVARVVLRDGS